MQSASPISGEAMLKLNKTDARSPKLR